MPVYVQKDEYDEEYDSPVEETEMEEEASEKEPEEVEDADEEEVPKKPKKKPVKKKKRSSRNTALIAGAAIGSTVLIGMVAVVGINVAKAKKVADQEAAEQEAFEQTQRLYEYHQEMGDQPTLASDETEAETQPTFSVTYTSAELKALRKWGYTASELEIASRDGLTPQELVDSARADREEAQKEALAAVSDTASDEYKKLLNQTWLGGEPLDVSQFTADYVYNTEERTEIADYEKCDPHGEQCFIKVYLDNGDAAFMQVTPQRFNELPDTGNMVVVIDDVTLNDVTVITSITEQRVN